TDLGKLAHYLGVKARDRPGGQYHRRAGAVARLDQQPLVEEVEIDLERPLTMSHGRGGEAAAGGVERDVPGVVGPWFLLEADLADNLRPPVQGVAGVFPFVVGQLWPAW